MPDTSLHLEERRQFERLLRQQRMDRIADRMAVLDAFLGSEDHHSVEGWQRLIKQRGQDLEPAFVAQTLELLNRFGLATRREFDGGKLIYEHRHLDEHHDHLICTCCGRISEFSDPQLEELQSQIAQRLGFHCLRHRHQIYGLCKDCLEKRTPTMPLTMAAPGEKVRVEAINGGAEANSQLIDLGIAVGVVLEVISANGGPMVLAIKGSRLAMGRGLAQKVLVSQLP